MGIFFGKFYRQAPELSDYSDDECRQMLLQAHGRRGDAMWIIPLALIGAMLLVATPVVVVAGLAVRKNPGEFFTDPAVHTVLGGAIIVLTIAAVIIWVFTRRTLLMRSVLRHMEKARCPYCLFSLTGLVIDMGAVICPECGQRVVLSEEGIHPDDLMPKNAPRAAWAPKRHETVELPPIPLEPDLPTQKKKIIKSVRLPRGETE